MSEAPFSSSALSAWVRLGCEDGLLSFPLADRTGFYHLGLGEREGTLQGMGGEPSWLRWCLGAYSGWRERLAEKFFRELPAELRVNRRTYRRLWRVGQVAIYEDEGFSGHFEVIFIRWREQEFLPSGRLAPAREIYPKSESWGSDGFTYTSNSHDDPLDCAIARKFGSGLNVGVLGIRVFGFVTECLGRDNAILRNVELAERQLAKELSSNMQEPVRGIIALDASKILAHHFADLL